MLPDRSRLFAVPIPISPDCLACHYQCLATFDHQSEAAVREFDHLGKLYSLPPGGALDPDKLGPGRVLILCSGQVRLTSLTRNRVYLDLQMSVPGTPTDAHTAHTIAQGDVTRTTVETVGPATARLVQRAGLAEFLGRHGQVAPSAWQPLSEVGICFLGCSGSGYARICCWSEAGNCSCFLDAAS